MKYVVEKSATLSTSSSMCGSMIKKREMILLIQMKRMIKPSQGKSAFLRNVLKV